MTSTLHPGYKPPGNLTTTKTTVIASRSPSLIEGVASTRPSKILTRNSRIQTSTDEPAGSLTGRWVINRPSKSDVLKGNVNLNAWGDDDRMRQVETTLQKPHWECVPEYKETLDKNKSSLDSGKKKPVRAGGQDIRQAKSHLMKKKSDKNLKALALIQSIGKNSHFSSDERIHLSTMFVQNFGAEKHPGLKLYCLDSRSFQRIMHATFGITNEKIIEGLYRVFDFAGNNLITEPEWIRGLSLFVRGKFEERLQVVWQVYDTNEDGMISREEMYTLLQDCLVKTKADDNDTEEAVKDLVEMLFRKLDMNHDGKVDKEDFWAAVKEDNLLLECCGQVFPSQRHVDVFEATFADEIAFKPT